MSFPILSFTIANARSQPASCVYALTSGLVSCLLQMGRLLKRMGKLGPAQQQLELALSLG